MTYYKMIYNVMCVCVYTSIYIYIYAHAYTYIYIYIYIYTCIHIISPFRPLVSSSKGGHLPHSNNTNTNNDNDNNNTMCIIATQCVTPRGTSTRA